MTYSKVLFIGYTLHTAPKGASFAEGFTMKDGVYQGLADNQKDIRARCDLVKKALEAAYSALQPAQKNNSALLKVFVIPEFFFHGKETAYRMDGKQNDISKLQKELQRRLKAKKWSDWVCFFGSALGFKHHSNGPQLLNVGLVHQGGPEAQAPISIEIPLAHAESLAGPEPTKLNGKAVWQDADTLAFDQTGHVYLADICFGQRLCKDHQRRAQRSRLSPVLPGSKKVQISVQPACGIDLEKRSGEKGHLHFICNGLLLGGCSLRLADGSLVKPTKTQTLKFEDVDMTALFAGKSSGRLHLYPPQPLPETEVAESFVDSFCYQTRDSHQMDFRFVYGREGKLERTEVVVTLSTGAKSKVHTLPCAVELNDGTHGLVARLAIRYAPVSDNGQDLLLFIDHEGGHKGAQHNFSSSVPVYQAPKAPPKKRAAKVTKPAQPSTKPKAASRTPKPAQPPAAKVTSKTRKKPGRTGLKGETHV